MFTKKGQSTLEYVLVLTAIIAAIVFATTQFIKPKVESSLQHVATEMEEEVNRIDFGAAAQ